MGNAAVLKESAVRRYAETDTATLMDLWAVGGRTEWAEALLRRELRNRGVSRLHLHAIATQRRSMVENGCPMVRARFWCPGWIGWLARIGTVVAAYALLHWIGGPELGAFGLILVAAIHAVALIGRLATGRQARTLASPHL